MKAKRAGRDVSGLSVTVAGQLVAAMEELENNIHEHADATETGILAYKAEPGAFEFVVADRGIGIRRSLRRCAAYAALQDDGRHSKRLSQTAYRATGRAAITATASGRSSPD